MKVLLFLARSSRRELLVALASSVLAGLGSSLLVALINQSLAASASEMLWLSLGFAGLALGVPLLRWLAQSRFFMLQQSALARLRTLVSTHLANAPYRDVEALGPGRLLALLVEDVGTVSEFFVTLPRLVMQGAIVGGGFAYLAWLSWQALLFSLGLVCAGALIHFWAVRHARDHLERARAAEDTLYEHFRALVAGSKELKLSGARRRAFLSDVLEPQVEAVRRSRTAGLLTYVGAGSWGAFMFFVVIGGVIFVLGTLIDVDAQVRSGYALVFLYMMFPLEDLLEAFPDMARTRIALDRIMEACGGSLTPRTVRAPEPAPGSFAQLSLRGVTHRYRRDAEDGVFELGPVSLELRPSELVFLVGGNGSGKTTLAKLLVGLYEPEAGQVALNGAPVDAEQRAAYRQHFSTVFSDFHLFDRLLGLSAEPLDARAHELLSGLGLSGKVTIRDGVFSTTALSSGQRKRLALLVAWLEDRPVYVFDEWAADQDPPYKEVFYRRVLPDLKARGKAVLVITHDDRYFQLADRCLKLESGKLVGADSLRAALPRVRGPFQEVTSS